MFWMDRFCQRRRSNEERMVRDALLFLQEIRTMRLLSGHYPARTQYLEDCCLDATELVDLLARFNVSWRVELVVLRVAAWGLYDHPDTLQTVVDDADILPILGSLKTLLQRRGYSLGCLERHQHGVTEDWGSCEAEQPLRIVRAADQDADVMAATLLREFFEFE